MVCGGLRAAGVGVLWSTSLAAAMAAGVPVDAAEATIERPEAVAAAGTGFQARLPVAPRVDVASQAVDAWLPERSLWQVERFAAITPDRGEAPLAVEHEPAIDADTAQGLRLGRVVGNGPGFPAAARDADDAPDIDLAQFRLPPAAPAGKSPEGQQQQLPQLPQQLPYQYAYGSESSIVYRKDQDLNKATRDNVLLVAPQVNGLIVYRPNNWLVATLEGIFEIEIPVRQEETVILPTGETRPDIPTNTQLLVDQMFVTIRNVTAPFEFNVGRRNYEDERHWLYDTSLDIASVSVRQGNFRAEAFAGREVFYNWNLWPNKIKVRDRIATSLLYVDYSGIEDMKLAAYTILRDDRTRNEGTPRLSGVRVLGSPSNRLNYWAELAFLGGKDATSTQFAGWGYDVGFTYRFPELPLYPNFTLAYAFGSGDDNPRDTKNRNFHQTGLQSNEYRFAGFTKFKYYGEALEPELSNIKIFTVGLGARPTQNFSVDLVYHKYDLDKIADTIPGSPITAQMAQYDPRLSKDVGQEFDLILGFRHLFGIRRLGVDLRFGWFLPGNAFIRNDGDDEDPILRKADRGFTFVAKLWW